jgi:ribosomal protein L15
VRTMRITFRAKAHAPPAGFPAASRTNRSCDQMLEFTHSKGWPHEATHQRRPSGLDRSSSAGAQAGRGTFGSFARKSRRLARLISRKSHHFVPRPSFGLCTREDARASNPNREKAWKIDRCCPTQTAFGHAPTLLMSNTRQKEKTSRERVIANCSL